MKPWRGWMVVVVHESESVLDAVNTYPLGNRTRQSEGKEMFPRF